MTARTLLFISIIIAGFTQVQAQKIELVPSESSITFKIKSWGLTVDGKFGGLDVTGEWHESDPSLSKLKGTVKSSTVDANIDGRNESLRGEEYFNVEKFPSISISSNSISKTADGYLFKGTLKMKETSKPLEFPFTVLKEGNKLILNGDFKINRLDYKVGESSMIMGDDVRVSINCAIKILP